MGPSAPPPGPRREARRAPIRCGASPCPGDSGADPARCRPLPVRVRGTPGNRWRGRPGQETTMTAQSAQPASSRSDLPAPSDELLAELEGVYKDIHAHPELSMQEKRTAALAAAWLRQHGYDVTEGIGGTGVVGLLRNGDG